MDIFELDREFNLFRRCWFDEVVASANLQCIRHKHGTRLGRYELTYLRNEKGAVIGEHIVTISTRFPDEVDYRGDVVGESGDGGRDAIVVKGRAESLPRKYTDRWKSELRATVTSGSNDFPFDLKKK